ncbi:MAG: carboxylating nicotinate-nucleotide diphosphorylase [Candidatus Helarchaeota archaeon]|nr:carboxylating nicotinate-nucleotide diphosphorylase [Candidatus Helarchaeota archaeon]
MELPKTILKRIIKEFLEVDVGFGDITTNTLIPDNIQATAEIKARENGVVAGIQEAIMVFELMNIKKLDNIKDGSTVKKDQTILKIKGRAKDILTAERTALNILMRMSGIATETNSVIKIVREINKVTRIACTRKVTPGFQYFEKRAVSLGGGDTHRFNLDDEIMVKDNHLSIFGDIRKAVEKIRKEISFSKKIEVEVETIDQVLEAANAGADIIMFDNFTPEKAAEALKLLEEKGLRDKVTIEFSGGINKNNVKNYAKLNPDVISMGYLIHSSKSLNINLEFIETK